MYTKLFISLSGELKKRKAVVNVQSTNKVQMWATVEDELLDQSSLCRGVICITKHHLWLCSSLQIFRLIMRRADFVKTEFQEPPYLSNLVPDFYGAHMSWACLLPSFYVRTAGYDDHHCSMNQEYIKEREPLQQFHQVSSPSHHCDIRVLRNSKLLINRSNTTRFVELMK